MAVIRVNKNKDYVVMGNFHLKDKNITLKAKGLLSLMLSLPNDWNYSINGLASICKENPRTIRVILQELKDFGYLKVTKKFPNETESGRIEYIYDIFENPKQDTQNQHLDHQDVGEQEVDDQDVRKYRQLNINKQSIKELNIKETKYEVDVDAEADESKKLQLWRNSVLLTEEQFNDLLEYMGIDVFTVYLKKLDNFILKNDANIKNHYKTLMEWYKKDRNCG